MISIIIVASVMSICMWVPYLTAHILYRGIPSTLAGNPRLSTIEIPSWANRLKQAHQNSLENLPSFLGVCIAAQLSGMTNDNLIIAGITYNIARVFHYVLYGMSVPVLRTLAFIVGWVATMYIGIMVITSI